MHIEALRELCLQFPGTTESFPFDETTLVFKAGGKMFVLASLEGPPAMTVKAPPEEIARRQEQYPDVGPGYHMNKKYWCTVQLTGRLPDETIRNWVSLSYHEVLASLPKYKQKET